MMAQAPPPLPPPVAAPGGGVGGGVGLRSRLDPLYVALLLFRQHRFEAAAAACTKMLEKNPYDEAAWSLKTRALTAQVKEWFA